MDHRHPGTSHAGNMESLIHLIVVIVQIEPGGSQVHLIGLFGSPDAVGKDGVNAGRQGAFVHRPVLVKIKIPLDGFPIKLILKNIDSLQDICLFDKTGAQDAVPRPVLVDGSLSRIQICCHHLLLVHKSILLQKHLQLFLIREMKFLNNVLPSFTLLFKLQSGFSCQEIKCCRILIFQMLQLHRGIEKCPAGHLIGVPVVVYIVFILIGTGHTQHYVLSFSIGPVDPLAPEA